MNKSFVHTLLGLIIVLTWATASQAATAESDAPPDATAPLHMPPASRSADAVPPARTLTLERGSDAARSTLAALSSGEPVTVTRWFDPQGREPITYKDWQAKQPPLAPFATHKRSTSATRDVVPPDAPHVYVIVNTTLYNSIQSSINQYVADLEAEGYAVTVYTTSGGTPQDLRTLLQGALAQNLVGSLLIGDLPVPWYEMSNDFSGYAAFPIDLYYMDLDGQWLDDDNDGQFDQHNDGSGDVGPEIWVGRLTAAPLSGDEATYVQNYLDKNHRYRTGTLRLAGRALSYIYDDWSGYGTADLDLTYGDSVTVMEELGMTSADDYVQRLGETHSFVHVMAHSSPWGHSFSTGWLPSTDIESIDPRAFFYNLFACSNARYVESNYMGGYYIFAPSYGLAAIGTTKTGSMLSFDQFYGPLGTGETLGAAYRAWFEYKAQNGFSLSEQQWHYGMTLLGDPTLTAVDPTAPTASITWPQAHTTQHATVNVQGSATDAAFSHYTLAYGSGRVPLTWTPVISASTPVVNGALGDWDTRPLSGTYTLKLTAQGDGRYSEDRVTLYVKNAEITAPAHGDILRPGTIDIAGTAVISGFERYQIEYGTGLNPVTWSTAGITLPDGGLSEVSDGALATMDASSITTADDYTLRLTVHSTSGQVYQDQVTLYIDPRLSTGWPQAVNGRIVAPSIAVGDLDGDGDMELVVTETQEDTYTPRVHAWHHDGSRVLGWPQKLSGTAWLSAPTLADLDRDGTLEVIVGASNHRVYAWHHDGTQVVGWPQWTGGDVYATPAVGDLDGDGGLEVVVGAQDDNVYVWHYDGVAMTGWPQATGDEVNVSPALADLDGDGVLDVVAGADDGQVYAWDHQGNALTGWPVSTPAYHIVAAPALGDIDGDGDIEVVIGGVGQTYAWHHDGTAVTGWPQTTAWGDVTSPALGDIDGGGDLEIFVAAADHAYAWHDDGTPVSGWPIPLTHSTHASPALGDLDGDGDLEIVLCSGDDDDQLYAWHDDGTPVSGWPRRVPVYGSGAPVYRLSTPFLEDVDRDGNIEISIGVEDKVLIWDLDGAYQAADVDWPTFSHDLWRTGFYTATLPNLPPLVQDVTVTPGYVPPSGHVTLTARVSDEDGVAWVTAEVESPDETVLDTLTLYDDGAHGDGAASDGVYGTVWTTPPTQGDYWVDLSASDGSQSYTHDNAASFTSQDVAYVQYHTHSISLDDINDDGTANPGEYVRLTITLENIGVLNAPGVTATLSTRDPYVIAHQSWAIDFGDIAPQGAQTVDDAFYFYVSTNCPHDRTIVFTLDIVDANGHTWTDRLDVTVIDNIGPDIWSGQVTPNSVPAGESVVVTVQVQDASGVDTVQALVESPDETLITTLDLYDDGAHDDGAALDGIYGNHWDTDATPRNYQVDLTAQDFLGNVSAHDNLDHFTTKTFLKQADVLLVVDDYTASTDWFRHYYTATLDAIGRSFDLWDAYWHGEIDANTLGQYVDGAVIWSTPDHGYLMYDTALNSLSAYLNGGGNLFISGQDIAAYLVTRGNTAFLNDYLHADLVRTNTNLSTLQGVPGDPIGAGIDLSIAGGDGADNQSSPDEITPLAPATPVFTYTAAGVGGLRVDTGTFKVLYLAFGFEGIDNPVDRATGMRRGLAWLLGTTPPTAAFTSSSPDWLGQTTVLTNSSVYSGAISYQWSFGDGVTSTLANPTYTFGLPGVHTVVLTTTSQGWRDVTTRTVTVYGAPTATFDAAPRQGSLPLTVTFTATSTTVPQGDPTLAYQWHFGDGGHSTLGTPTHRYTATGVYTVTMTTWNAAGHDTVTRTHFITVSTPPRAGFHADPTSGMAPLTVYFSNDTSGDYAHSLWDFGDGQTSTLTHPVHIYEIADTYTVTLTVNGPDNEDTAIRAAYIIVQDNYRFYLPAVLRQR